MKGSTTVIGDPLLTPGEVAAQFRVDPKTVSRWAAAGRLRSIRTPGGHRRFRASEIKALLEAEAGEQGIDDTPGLDVDALAAGVRQY